MYKGKLGVVMDPIQAIHFKKDSTLAILLEAQARGWALNYMEQGDLFSKDGIAYSRMRGLRVFNNPQHWFEFTDDRTAPLHELQVIFMRKDPPFNLEYIYTTYLLELAEAKGSLIVNKPQSLRDANEKVFTNWFPQCTPPSLISADAKRIRAFITEQKDVILKPLHGMGGSSIFRLRKDDVNINVVIETLTSFGNQHIMAQRFIAEIAQGDKRIFLINGKPIPYALARIPSAGDIRGNLAAGGKGVGVELTKRDYWICEQLSETLRAKGLLFVGIDVIGDYLTEINVTSPTCIREIESFFNINISGQLLDCIENNL